MSGGWLRLHRQILDWEWYNEPNTFRLFIHLLLKANHKQNKWQGKTIEAGQLVTGRKQLALELKLSEQKIRTSLERLKSTNEITIKSTSKYSIITICKWETYQPLKDTEQPTEQPATQPTNNQQITTNKNDKNNKNLIKGIFDAFRTQYPGQKRGLEEEFKNFIDKNKLETVHLLLPALNKELHYRQKAKAQGEFVPAWKHLKTWINQKCWTQEFPRLNGTPKTETYQKLT
jgi:hypothetical protein